MHIKIYCLTHYTVEVIVSVGSLSTSVGWWFGKLLRFKEKVMSDLENRFVFTVASTLILIFDSLASWGILTLWGMTVEWDNTQVLFISIVCGSVFGQVINILLGVWYGIRLLIKKV